MTTTAARRRIRDRQHRDGGPAYRNRHWSPSRRHAITNRAAEEHDHVIDMAHADRCDHSTEYRYGWCYWNGPLRDLRRRRVSCGPRQRPSHGQAKVLRLRTAGRRYSNPYPYQPWNLPDDHPWYKPIPF